MRTMPIVSVVLVVCPGLPYPLPAEELVPEAGTCGDVDGVEGTRITDAVYLLNYLFLGGPPPVCGVSLFDPTEGGSCGRSAELAVGACKHGALAQYRLAVARCANLAQPYEIEACLDEARETFDEAMEECDGQSEARIELCGSLGDGPYVPVIDPSRFVDVIDNPYLPLIPGTSFLYEKKRRDGGTELITITVGREKRNVMGVDCTVIFEKESVDGDEEEETANWFAQDVEGNVWLFGELSYEIDDGVIIGVEGSWEAGVDGARPGIAMRASSVPGDVYRQEYFLGEAEDAARIIALDAAALVPRGSYAGCLVTEEFTPLEPSAREQKYYAAEVGLVLEVDLETGERLELVEIRKDEP